MKACLGATVPIRTLGQSLSIFDVMRVTAANFDPHASNMKFNTQNKARIIRHIITCTILLLVVL